ncbi:MAG: transcriptional regulator BolA [Porticoccaceae bacterium]|nr:MAG: transcriptional regulator BolA [Porticoccaceae bacterium]
MAARIEAKLRAAFAPRHLEIVDESHRHAVPPGAESHFRVVLVSAAFAGLSRIARHRAVYRCLAEELAGPVHALALHTFAPEEWAGEAPPSPPCLGGDKGRAAKAPPEIATATKEEDPR